MDRRVRIIRGWLLVALAIAGALLIDPVLWFGLATILACDPCCPSGPICADRCDPDFGGTWQLVITGIVNKSGSGCTGCDALNGTYETDTYPGGTDFLNECQWEQYFTSSVSCPSWPPDNDGVASCSVGFSGGIHFVSAAIAFTKGGFASPLSAIIVTWRKDYTSDPIDCGSVSEDLTDVTVHQNNFCDPTSSSCTASAL